MMARQISFHILCKFIEGALRKLVALGELKREGRDKSTCYLRMRLFFPYSLRLSLENSTKLRERIIKPHHPR